VPSSLQAQRVAGHTVGYFWNILVWLDQGTNVVLSPVLNQVFHKTDHAFGDPDETLTSVFGKYQETCKLCKFMCFWLGKIDPGHCEKGIERDEGKNPT